MAIRRSEWVSTAELSSWLDCTARHILDLAKEGILERAVDEDGKEKLGRWSLKSSVVRYVRFMKSKQSASAESKVTLDELNRRQLLAKVERSELILEAQRGTLHPSKLIYDLYSDRIRAARETALSLPNKIAQQLADETDVAKVYKVLTGEIEEMLNRLSEPKTEEVMRDTSKYIPVEEDDTEVLE